MKSSGSSHTYTYSRGEADGPLSGDRPYISGQSDTTFGGIAVCPSCEFAGKCIIGIQPRPRNRRIDWCPSCLEIVPRHLSQLDYSDDDEEMVEDDLPYAYH